MRDPLDKILAELDCEHISNDYIIKGIIVTRDNICIDIDKDILDIFLNKTPDDVTEEENEIIQDLFDILEPGYIYCELKIIIDIDRIKKDINEYVDSLINKHFR